MAPCVPAPLRRRTFRPSDAAMAADRHGDCGFLRIEAYLADRRAMQRILRWAAGPLWKW